MGNENSSYRNIFKATSLFGGVQVIQILANLIKGKFAAILIGATGMGMISLFTVPVSMIINISGLGLGTSAVKDISQLAERDNDEELGKILFIFKRLVLYSCVAGGLMTLLGSYWLSVNSFGNSDYVLQFIFLTLMVIGSLLYQANVTILQGLRQLKKIAQLSIINAISTFSIALICYYFWGIQGIVPAMIVPVWINFIFAYSAILKLDLPSNPVKFNELWYKGKIMISFGFALVISAFLGQLCTYILNVFISKVGEIKDVGFMNAAISMTTMSITMVFAAMATDYFPRLSAVADNKDKMNSLVNRQSEILILIVTPLLIIFSISAPVLIRIFLAQEFIIITEFIRIVAIGMFFKAASYAIGYISFAKSDKKVFFYFEGVVFNIFSLLTNIVFYYYFGLSGLAISFAINYIIYYISVSLLFSNKYGYKISPSTSNITSISFVFSAVIFGASFLEQQSIYFIVCAIVLVSSLLFSYKELDARLDIKEFVKKKFS